MPRRYAEQPSDMDRGPRYEPWMDQDEGGEPQREGRREGQRMRPEAGNGDAGGPRPGPRPAERAFEAAERFGEDMQQRGRNAAREVFGAAEQAFRQTYGPAAMMAWPARAGLVGFEVWLCAAREMSDVSTQLLRRQQDMLLDAMRMPLQQQDGRSAAEDKQLAQRLREPVRRMGDAYQDMGDAVMESQTMAARRTMRVGEP